ncbi:ribonuclease D [Acuticoccus sp. MNP-M23]|uniref:ribonuclease D n=1 Tax=Acuticoccus sp. MNP-M23 TaxID=3072793 RepID=UPI002814A568|nr:ribonuclease D [Acuticoccus sp. MNP-M23]WMS41681.1 ribonuclease D [Acuticoccus sp. MNP-M23]
MDVITDTDTLAALCERLRTAPFVTVDTEFMRETTFWPKLCLVQVASTEDAAVIDPLADGISLEPLFALLADERVLKVFHAARQDIEIFHHLSGSVPTPIFDTQVAAMVCGFGDSIAYDQIVQRVTGATVDKSSRFTNWAERPLSEAQLTYALADVTHLRDVYVHLRDTLEARGRHEWVAEEMAMLASPDTYDLKPEDAWRRLKSRARQPVELAVLQEIAALREREARSRDVPRNRVLKDDVIYEIGLQRPRTPEALGKLRAVSKGFERSRLGAMVLDAVNEVLARPSGTLPSLPKRKQSIEGANAAVDLMKVLLKLCAEAEGVAPKVLATVDDLEAIVSGEDTPALNGWRKVVFGDKALQLKDGDIAIAFDGRSLRTIDCARPVNPAPGSVAGKKGRRRRKKSGDDAAVAPEAAAEPAAEK